MTDPDPLEELATLTAALRAHAELCALSGAVGLEPAPRPAERAGADARATEAPATQPRAVAAVSPASQASRAEHSERPAASAPNASARTALPLAPGAERLASLAREVARCTRCGLHRDRTQTVFARGTGSSGLCFVGEGPGADE